MKQLVLASIRLYQRYLSLDTGILSFLMPIGPICRMTPRCSQYTYDAVSRYGIIYGLWLGVKRIGRCHPWNQDTHDPVPQKMHVTRR